MDIIRARACLYAEGRDFTSKITHATWRRQDSSPNTQYTTPHTYAKTDPAHLPWAHHNIISHRSQSAFLDIRVDDVRRDGFDSADFFPKRFQRPAAPAPADDGTPEQQEAPTMEEGLRQKRTRTTGTRRKAPAMVPVPQSLHFRPPALLYQVINVTEVRVNNIIDIYMCVCECLFVGFGWGVGSVLVSPFYVALIVVVRFCCGWDGCTSIVTINVHPPPHTNKPTKHTYTPQAMNRIPFLAPKERVIRIVTYALPVAPGRSKVMYRFLRNYFIPPKPLRCVLRGRDRRGVVGAFVLRTSFPRRLHLPPRDTY